MSYRILRCKVCGHPIHQHEDGRLTNLCEHLREPMKRLAGRYLTPFWKLEPELLEAVEQEMGVEQ